MENKILLLGSGGFLGSFLSINLPYNLVQVTRKECDLTDFNSVTKLLKTHNPEVIINCAGNLERNIDSFNTEYFNQNMKIFFNLFNQKDYFGKLINFGSGAEFDRKYSINLKNEDEIKFIKPTDHYGLSKNIISNICLLTDNFYTLRLFGCFSSSNNPLFDAISKQEKSIIENKYFDFFYIYDVLLVLKHFIEKSPTIKDINLVYSNKKTLYEIAEIFIRTHNLSSKIFAKENTKNYTGSSSLIDSLGLNFKGLEEGMKHYTV